VPGNTCINAVRAILAKILITSKTLMGEVSAGWLGAVGHFALFGTGRDGEHFQAVSLEHGSAGTGANIDCDGVDTGGLPGSPTSHITDVEVFERQFPILYLFRRQTTDSGGPGKFRGGVGGELAMINYEAPRGIINYQIMPFGYRGGNSLPLFGGYPSDNCEVSIIRESDIHMKLEKGDLPENLEEYIGISESIRSLSTVQLSDRGIIYHSWMGGGGFGDPLERDPELVAKDVKNELVSLACAANIYGVIIVPETFQPDIGKTKEQRDKLRASRLRAKR
jgi:N-methylhydantoinase B